MEIVPKVSLKLLFRHEVAIYLLGKRSAFKERHQSAGNEFLLAECRSKSCESSSYCFQFYSSKVNFGFENSPWDGIQASFKQFSFASL